jgi:hypothetical protein
MAMLLAGREVVIKSSFWRVYVSMIPSSRDAHILARIFAGQDVALAEIRAMADPTCAMIATILLRSRDNGEQQKAILGTLLADNAIDEGPFEAAILRADPTRPFIDPWPEPIRSDLPTAKPFPLSSFPIRFVQAFIKDAATAIGCPIEFRDCRLWSPSGRHWVTPAGCNSSLATGSRDLFMAQSLGSQATARLRPWT